MINTIDAFISKRYNIVYNIVRVSTDLDKSSSAAGLKSARYIGIGDAIIWDTNVRMSGPQLYTCLYAMI